METIHLRYPIEKSSVCKRESCVLALGFFDGIHVGHRAILEKAKQIAKQKRLKFGVMTFFPHPKDILFPEKKPMKYLTPLKVKEEGFKELGVEKLFIVEFTPEFSALSPKEFVDQYICSFQCKHVVAGFDYCYGAKGKGNMATMAEHGEGEFEVTVISKVKHHYEKISSTAIRGLLAHGRVRDIPSYLGRPYQVQGTPIYYSHVGQNNIFMEIHVDRGYRLPKPGLYKLKVEVNGSSYEGVCHQMFINKTGASLLIQMKKCDGREDFNSVIISWLDFIKGEPNKLNDMNEYIQRDELVI